MISLVNQETITRELLTAALLAGYVLLVVYGTKLVYKYLRNRGLPHNVAIYYNRKIIHVAAGGIVAVLVPFLFQSPIVPFLMALSLGAFLYYWHWKGKLLDWFQTRENMYEVNFTIAWGISLLLLWLLTGDPKIAVVPSMFIAFGDAITGVIRNAVFAKRTKHWYGNLGMLAVVLPLGYLYAGELGALAGIISSIIERYEFPPIDDNILIALASTGILLAGTYI